MFFVVFISIFFFILDNVAKMSALSKIDLERGRNRKKVSGHRQSYESVMNDKAIRDAWLEMSGDNPNVEKILNDLSEFDETDFFEDIDKGLKVNICINKWRKECIVIYHVYF